MRTTGNEPSDAPSAELVDWAEAFCWRRPRAVVVRTWSQRLRGSDE